jgi:hypothetical protein
MMIESAYKLLNGENPQEGEEGPEIIDGHAATIGQATRTALCRFVLTLPDQLALSNLEQNRVYNGQVCEVLKDKTFTARLVRIG